MSVIQCGRKSFHMGHGNLSAVAGPAEGLFTHTSSSQSLLGEDRAILVTGVHGYVADGDAFCTAS